MSITVVLSLAIAVIGVVVYLLTSHPKVMEIARLAFAVGLLAFLLTFSGTLSLAAH